MQTVNKYLQYQSWWHRPAHRSTDANESVWWKAANAKTRSPTRSKYSHFAFQHFSNWLQGPDFTLDINISTNFAQNKTNTYCIYTPPFWMLMKLAFHATHIVQSHETIISSSDGSVMLSHKFSLFGFSNLPWAICCFYV